MSLSSASPVGTSDTETPGTTPGTYQVNELHPKEKTESFKVFEGVIISALRICIRVMNSKPNNNNSNNNKAEDILRCMGKQDSWCDTVRTAIQTLITLLPVHNISY